MQVWQHKDVAFVRKRKKNAPARYPITGTAQVDARTKNLTKRLAAGSIAVIDHEDLDRVSAEGLVESRVAAVVNAARSTSGRYPNLGPGILLEAGIPLIDDCGHGVMDLSEGTPISITEDGSIFAGEHLIAQGTVQSVESNAANLEAARSGIPLQLKAFAANTMEYIETEQNLILDGVGVPEIRTPLAGRHVLVVVRGYQFKEDLITLRPYIREYRPVIIGVDGGADAVLEAGYDLDMIVGDMDSVSDKALRSGAEIVVHAYRDGSAPGKRRVEDLGVEHVVFPATGTSEDVAMLLADNKNAQLIVLVGSHSSLIEFLDKGRHGMASTFLTRLRVGSKLVDAKGVSSLYRSRISNWQLVLLVVAGAIAIGAAMVATSAGQITFDLVRVWISDLFQWVKNLF